MNAEKAPKRDKPREASSTPAATKVSASVGIVAAMVLAVLVNVLAARHYKRWDWTKGGLYTLSDATVQTLRSLEEPVRIHVLLSEGDPLTLSLRHLLDSYRGEASRVVVEFIDADRRPAEFIAIQQRFGIVAGKTEDGKIVTDAAVVVSRGDRPHFISLRDLVETEDQDDVRRRPRLEQALTFAIRSVMSTERPKACFTTGHGEGAVEPGAGQTGGGLGPFRESLVKNNFEVVDVGAVAGDNRSSELEGCRVLILAGPTERVPAEDVARYRAYVEKGGSVFVALGPALDSASQRTIRRGLGDLLGLFGVEQNDDVVFELDPSMRPAQGFGEAFMPNTRPHPVTEGLRNASERRLGVVLTLASSLGATGAGAASATPLLVTSDQAFGMVDFFTWAKTAMPPAASPADRKGPLTMAFASERPKVPGSTAPHGARMVVVGSASVLFGANWQADALRGTSLFVGSAISWLAASPVMLDIPTKPAFTAGLHVTDQWLASTFRYVVVYIPLASVLLAIAVRLRRKAFDRRPDAKPSTDKKPD